MGHQRQLPPVKFWKKVNIKWIMFAPHEEIFWIRPCLPLKTLILNEGLFVYGGDSQARIMPPKKGGKGKKPAKRPYQLKVDVNQSHQRYLNLIVSTRNCIAEADFKAADLNLQQILNVPGLSNDPYVTYLKKKFDRESAASPSELSVSQKIDRRENEILYFAEEASHLFAGSWPMYQALITSYIFSGRHGLARKLLDDSAALASENLGTSDHHKRLLQDLEERAQVPAQAE